MLSSLTFVSTQSSRTVPVLKIKGASVLLRPSKNSRTPRHLRKCSATLSKLFVENVISETTEFTPRFAVQCAIAKGELTCKNLRALPILSRSFLRQSGIVAALAWSCCSDIIKFPVGRYLRRLWWPNDYRSSQKTEKWNMFAVMLYSRDPASVDSSSKASPSLHDHKEKVFDLVCQKLRSGFKPTARFSG